MLLCCQVVSVTNEGSHMHKPDDLTGPWCPAAMAVATLCYAMPCCATPRDDMPCYDMPCCAVLWCAGHHAYFDHVPLAVPRPM